LAVALAIVVLDEATSALDPASQDYLMGLLTNELSATTIVSVAHRPELEVFHDRKITLQRQRGGAMFASDIHLLHRQDFA
jgi:vitamin B12/bleomycin/antimicrobial peptide transport system ATP-binding/permease protein